MLCYQNPMGIVQCIEHYCCNKEEGLEAKFVVSACV